MQLRTVDNREAEVAGSPSGLLALHLPLFVVGQVGGVVFARGNTLWKILILSKRWWFISYRTDVIECDF